MAKPRKVAIVVFPQLQVLDAVGPLEVFTAASQLAGGGEYEVELVASSRDAIATSSGLQIVPHRTTARQPGSLDTVIVAGGLGAIAAERDERLVRWIERAAANARRVTSVCSGAFLLAHAGLLDGRRATTHWASCEYLAKRYPAVEVEHDSIFVRDGNVWTSAGVTAGMDLALALVEEDLGREIALETARWLVLFMQRPGGQSQFSSNLSAQLAERRPLRDLQAWIVENPDADLSVDALADRAHMSPRNFARAFKGEVGLTPARYVEAVRVERASAALESTSAPIERIARDCGFGTPETMRRAFGRRLGVAPGDYRRRFASTSTTTKGDQHADRIRPL